MALTSAFVVHGLLVFVVTFVVLLAVFKHDNRRENARMAGQGVSGRVLEITGFWWHDSNMS